MKEWTDGLFFMLVFLFPTVSLVAIVYFGVLYSKGKRRVIKKLSESKEIFTIPNIITGLGIVSIFLQIPCFLLGYYFLVLILFLFSAVSDVLDGLAASQLNQRSRLGRLMDPARDRLQLAVGLWMMISLTEVPLFWWLLIPFFELLIFVLKQAGRIEVHSLGKIRQAIHLFLFLFLFVYKTEITFWDFGNNPSSQIFFLMSVSSGITFFIYLTNYLTKILKIKKGGYLKFLIFEKN